MVCGCSEPKTSSWSVLFHGLAVIAPLLKGSKAREHASGDTAFLSGSWVSGKAAAAFQKLRLGVASRRPDPRWAVPFSFAVSCAILNAVLIAHITERLPPQIPPVVGSYALDKRRGAVVAYKSEESRQSGGGGRRTFS